MVIKPEGSLPEIILETSPHWQDYHLLDSGEGWKLEQYGAYRLARPEPEAIWKKALPDREWERAAAVFQPSAEENGGHWVYRQKLPEHWLMAYRDLRFRVQTTASRHVGVFPEQAAQWDWIREQAQAAGRGARVLNLFGYTGLATIAAAAGGAQVTHVDASKKVVTWARENLEHSGLGKAPVRWIVDDALKFVQRENRRNSHYEGLILDPPKFGRGPKGEVWEFYALLPNLLESCAAVMSEKPRFIVLTAYAVKASALTLYYGLEGLTRHWGGHVTAGEVLLKEESAGRAISVAIFGRWNA